MVVLIYDPRVVVVMLASCLKRFKGEERIQIYGLKENVWLHLPPLRCDIDLAFTTIPPIYIAEFTFRSRGIKSEKMLLGVL